MRKHDTIFKSRYLCILMYRFVFIMTVLYLKCCVLHTSYCKIFEILKMSNPSHLTKAQLKEALTTHGIKFPEKGLKSVYVDLYNTYINQSRGEFSSDENYQVSISSTQTTKNEEKETVTDKQQLKKKSTSSTKNYTSPLEYLTNLEIADKLRKLGQTVGPVGRTTRQLYLKRLDQLLQNGGQDTLDQYSNSESESEEDPPVVPRTRSSTRRTIMNLSDIDSPIVSRKSSSNQNKRRSVGTRSSSYLADTPVVSVSTDSATRRRPLRIVTSVKTEEVEIVEQRSSPAKEKVEEQQEEARTEDAATAAESGVSFADHRWLKVSVVALIIMFFLYVCLQSMEPIPKLALDP